MIDNYDDEIKRLNRIKDYLEYENLLLSESIIDVRLKQKKCLKEKIKILFICHRPEVWNSLKTVYEAFCRDSSFETVILAIPNKKQLPQKGLSHEVYESEGAEEFWREYNCVCGYDYESKTWIDPRDLQPDYVFFQQPYNVTRPIQYKSWIVSKYAKICYVTYGFDVAEFEIYKSSHPIDFMKSVFFYFTADSLQYKIDKSWFREMENFFTRLYMAGMPRMDLICKHTVQRGNLFKLTISKILWMPRWSTRENNSFFFEYKDKWLDYCDKNYNVSLVFRPHPQAFMEWESMGEMSKDEAFEYKNAYNIRKNAKIDDEKDYLKAFEDSDCLVADFTSLLAEYFLTGKPIVYCHRVDSFNEFGRKLAEGFYWVRNWDELVDTLQMLRCGEDPLYSKRIEIMEKVFYHPDGGAGNAIKEIIKKDAMK